MHNLIIKKIWNVIQFKTCTRTARPENTAHSRRVLPTRKSVRLPTAAVPNRRLCDRTAMLRPSDVPETGRTAAKDSAESRPHPQDPFPGSAVRRIPRNSVRHTTPFRSRHPRPAPDAEPQNATKPCRPERIPFSTTQPFITYTGNRLHTGVRQSGCRTLPQ